MKEITNCLLCESKDIKVVDTRGVDASHWRCARCGEVLLARTMIVTLPKYENLWRLSAYCTCKNDNISKNRIHFDIAQENTIFWDLGDVESSEVRSYEDRKKADNIYLSEKIFDRIISIFGYGGNKQ